MSRPRNTSGQGRSPARPRIITTTPRRQDREASVPEERLLAKLAQLARFGLVAEAAPILVPTDPEET